VTLSRDTWDTIDSQAFAELGMGNDLVIDSDTLLRNIRTIQADNDIDRSDSLIPYDTNDNGVPIPALTVEMETGTGKTYVYVRSIFELHKKYGMKKFVIVVPSVAIREGVLKTLQITQDHFKDLYGIPYEYFIYSGSKPADLRKFATSNHVQIMVINIDAFRKNFTGTEEEKKWSLFFRETDKLSGRAPVEFVRAVRPFVIVDEPQSVDNTPKAKDAIKSLNPLAIVRYSATHREYYNLVYRLDPIRAFELRLVKQVIVASVVERENFNWAYVKLEEVWNKWGIYAKLTINHESGGAPKRKTLKLKQWDNLFEISGERSEYRDNYIIEEIYTEPWNEYLEFNDGNRIVLGQEIGWMREDVQEIQIRKTIQKHLDKELSLLGKGIKVLSLFFIDKVANYREYDESWNQIVWKFARIFDEIYSELIAHPKYSRLTYPEWRFHDGYFSADKKWWWKDTKWDTQADDDTYERIMKDKERLLSLDDPLRFIFSHSALKEWWDNPNVFQICTLNETQSQMKKRQEIGRGLRIPVDMNGDRVNDENINRLTVIANESYEDFARNLQTEYLEEGGVAFGKVPKTAFSRIMIDNEELWIDASEIIWDTLKVAGIINADGKIIGWLKPTLERIQEILPTEYIWTSSEVVNKIASYLITNHVKNDAESRKLKVNKEVYLDPDFQVLWNQIKQKTTYSVEYSTDDLIRIACEEVRKMPEVWTVKVSYREAMLSLWNAGIDANEIRSNEVEIKYSGLVPDILSLIQKETELTRSTIVAILKWSWRLWDCLKNPQKFIELAVTAIKKSLRRLMVDGIKYEKIDGSEYMMELFEEKEIYAYLTSLVESGKSIYDGIPYDSDVERKFAEQMNQREDIKLFVKLPDWFKIETPIGTYNPDWAIVKTRWSNCISRKGNQMSYWSWLST
jgi:type III restriction enzyme